MKLQIVVPMAGLGKRFKDEGVETPKPFIQIDQQAMFEWALSSILSHHKDCSIHLIIRDEHLTCLTDEMKQKYQVISLTEVTRGALETCSYALPFLQDDLPVLILDSDLYFEAKTFFDFMKNDSELAQSDGALITFSSNENRFSYAQVEAGLVQAVKEKVVISEHAIIGGYFLSRASILRQEWNEIAVNANQYLQKGELYLSSLYQKLLAKKAKIRHFQSSEFLSFGTPSELKESLKSGKLKAI